MNRQQKRILVVDDCDDIRANLIDILQDVGYEVDEAADGASALRLIRQHEYGVALLDFKMPGMDGAALAEEIKQTRPELAAIMITAYSGGTAARRVVENGTVQLLRKPVEVGRLLPMVRQAFIDDGEPAA